MEYKDIIEKRYNDNIKILDILRNHIEKHKDIRFEQLLYILNIIPKKDEDLYYEEPNITLNKIYKIINHGN